MKTTYIIAALCAVSSLCGCEREYRYQLHMTGPDRNHPCVFDRKTGVLYLPNGAMRDPDGTQTFRDGSMRIPKATAQNPVIDFTVTRP